MGGTGRVEIARSPRDCILVVAGGLVGAAISLALPSLLGRAIDSIFQGSSPIWAMTAAAVIALGVLADLLDTFASASYSAGATAGLRARLVCRALSVAPHRLA